MKLLSNPLYPGFLAFLSSKFSEGVSKKTYAMLGVVISLGVITFMLLFWITFHYDIAGVFD